MWWHPFYCDLYASVNLSYLSRSSLVLDFCFELKKTQIPETTPHRTVMKIKVKKWRMARHPGVSLNLQKILPLGILHASCQKGLSLLECKTQLLLFPFQTRSFSKDQACSHLGLPGVPGHSLFVLARAQDIDKTARELWDSLSEVKGCVHLFLEYELD